MDIVSAVLTSMQLFKDSSSSVCDCFNYHKLVDENCTTLRDRMERLRSREVDINAQLQNAQYQRHKKERTEVETWLKELQRMKIDTETVLQEAGKRRCFSRLSFLRRLEKRIEEVKDLLEFGKFPEGVLIDVREHEGKALLTRELIGETTAKRNLEKIWRCLGKSEIPSIGVWGMGGIGKTTVVTHIHNRLLENNRDFGPVYWVTVSKDSSIRVLQDAIGKKIGLDLSDEGDERIRCASLVEALQQIKRFVFILDDVWEVYEPEEIGIPLGVGVDAGKLLVTSRSLNVCLGMGCREMIKMESLSDGEAWELFNKMLCRHTGLSEKEEEIANDIVRECDGLPLAVITTARSMRSVYEINVWKNALNELREPIQRHTVDIENKVFKILGFSYNHLNDVKLQECLLYCALFPEDYEIPKLSLIRCWIAEGLVDEMGSWVAELQRGHAILNKLENVCLLERCRNGRCVKMHDVVRDMAINISAKNSRFMVKAGRNMNGLASQREWSENLERVSFMHCGNLSLTSSVPNCPKLSTLFLQRSVIEEVPMGLFEQMRSLKVLDLSETRISFLPDSISDLENLRALLLCGCGGLKHVPSLGKLTELRELDVSGSGVEAVPDGIENLVLLKRFALEAVRIEKESLSVSLRRALPNLLHLQCLRLDVWTELDVGVEELIGLRELKILALNFSTIQNFNSYVETGHCQNLPYYYLQLMPERRTSYVVSARLVSVRGSELKPKREDKLVLPTNIQVLEISHFVLSTSLTHVFPSLHIPKDLKVCLIRISTGIEYLWCAQDCSASLHSLRLEYLPDLRLLFKLPTTNYTSFFSLNRLFIIGCPNIKHMFTPGLVKHHLQNLQYIGVYGCHKMKDIIVSAEAEEMNNPILCFPNLQRLRLEYLQELESIWKGTMACDSLGYIKVWCCPKLKRIPISVSVHMNNGDGERRASTPPLQKIYAKQEWWDMVDWDTHPDAKSIFQPLLANENISRSKFEGDEGEELVEEELVELMD